ncbi:hypothetical protein FB451DRAFT_1292222 [Mycena latifolia]|nr:hypothetical protein FB451DRAFT_1292222 [Mycena latifolia]
MSTLNYVDKIPTEIWLRCWALCSKRHLRRLALACRYFRTLCLPLLFQHQSFSAPHPTDIDRDSWIGITQGIHRTYLRLGKLAASTHVSSVRTWHFGGCSDLVGLTHPDIVNVHLIQATYVKVLQRFTSTLGVYQKLHSLRLDDIFFGANLRQTLSSLTQLEELNLNNCTVGPSIGPLLHLRKLTVSGPRVRTEELNGGSLELVSPDALSCLKLDGSPGALYVLSALIDNTLTLLVDLTIYFTPPIADIFFTSIVGNGCPRLENLHITHVSHAVALPAHIPPAAMPLLQSFKGKLELVRLFVPGRPVTFIRVSGPITVTTPEILSVLADIAQSSVAPHVLELHPRIGGSSEVFATLSTLLPDLRQLSLELNEPSRYWPPLVVADPSSSPSSDNEEDWPWAPDTRTVELSDNGTLDSVNSDRSDRPSDDGDRFVELPATVKPGYMYSRSGKEFHPPADEVQDEDPELFPGVVEGMCAGRIALPPHIEVLYFRQPPSWSRSAAFARNDQHRVILRLGAVQPALREIGFTKNSGTVWTRREEMWTQRDSGTKIIALSTEGRRGDASGLAEDSLATENDAE